MNRKKIYIIGAGYGGIKALSHLVEVENADIFLIDQNSYHYLQTDVYDYLAGEVSLADIAIDLYTYCASFGKKNVTFVHEEVLRIDFKQQKIIMSTQRCQYDYLIISSGSQTRLPDSIEGLKKQYHGIKSLDNALKFKQKFETHIFQKIKDEGRCSRKTFNIIIAGGGLSGVEIATQMASYAKTFYKSTGYLCSNVNITLVNSSQFPLASNSTFMQKTALKRLNTLGIKLIKDAHVTKVLDKKVILNQTQEVDMDFLIWTAGIAPSNLVENMDIQKSPRGQILVDEFYRTLDYKNVFAIGDNAHLFNPLTKEVLAPTAQAAELSGKYVARNIKMMLQDDNPTPQCIKLHGFLASFGGKFGAAELFTSVKIRGKMAYYLKKGVEMRYRIPLQQKCKIGYKKLIKSRQ